MAWEVKIADDFEPELHAMGETIRNELLARAQLLAEFGPNLGRPSADTMKGSRYANMKELRFEAGGGVWRVAYAFDPRRKGILLVAGDKRGASRDRFYKALIRKADMRYEKHLKEI